MPNNLIYCSATETTQSSRTSLKTPTRNGCRTPQEPMQIARPAPVAPWLAPPDVAKAASSAQGHYVQFSHPTDEDGVTTLYAYNALGQQTVIAIDVDRNGLIDQDGDVVDTVTRTESDYENHNHRFGGLSNHADDDHSVYFERKC